MFLILLNTFLTVINITPPSLLQVLFTKTNIERLKTLILSYNLNPGMQALFQKSAISAAKHKYHLLTHLMIQLL